MVSILYIASLIISLFPSAGFIEGDQLPTDEKEKTYQTEIDRWHSHRIDGLKKEYGWLSLIDLVWLNEGKNEIPLFGNITLKKGKLLVTIRKNIHATIQGKIFTSDYIQPEKDKIVFGSKAFVVILRDGRYGVRIWDFESTVRQNFTGIERYPVSSIWRIEARWETFSKSKKIEIPTVIPGIFGEGVVPGAAVFTLNGKEYRLEPIIENGETEYFFVFGDKTNGKGTYPAGRFLYANPPVDGKIILDFNKSTNPPCAFTNFATCPVPLKENKLTIKIEAGEKKYSHH